MRLWRCPGPKATTHGFIARANAASVAQKFEKSSAWRHSPPRRNEWGRGGNFGALHEPSPSAFRGRPFKPLLWRMRQSALVEVGGCQLSISRTRERNRQSRSTKGERHSPHRLKPGVPWRTFYG